jgi:hypothetical protein
VDPRPPVVPAVSDMSDPRHDRRHEARALTAALIEVVDEYNDTNTCVLEDLSPSGACIQSDIALRVGARR